MQRVLNTSGYLIIVFLLLTCKQQENDVKIYNSVNQRYDELFKIFSANKTLCDLVNQIVFISPIKEMIINRKAKSQRELGLFEFKLKKPLYIEDQNGKFQLNLEKITTNQFTFRYISNHTYVLPETTIKEADRGRLRCKCDLVIN